MLDVLLDAEFLHLVGLLQDAAGAVNRLLHVGEVGGEHVDVATEFLGALSKEADAGDELFGQTDNLLLVLSLRVLAPGYLYHAEDGKKVLGAGDEDLLIEGFDR